MPNTCTVEGCLRTIYAKGYCQSHYVRVRKYGDPGSGRIGRSNRRDRQCEIEGCEKSVYAKDWCLHHYENNRFRGNPRLEGPGQGKRPSKWEGITCSVEGCYRPVKTRGWCVLHYARVGRFGDPGQAKPLMAPKGAGTTNQNGYREISVDGIRVLEHRYVMSQIMGRPLETTENVHHANGNRADNRPENLQLWTTSQPPRQSVIDLVAWAQSIIEKYGDEARRESLGGP